MAVDYPPKILPDGGAKVSPAQLELHKTTEGLSLFLGAPLMLWAATRSRKLNGPERAALALLAFGALLVDGYLYGRFQEAEKAEEGPP